MPQIVEGVELRDVTLETIAYLQYAYECLEAGEEHRIMGDPGYEREAGKAPLDEAYVNRVIDVIDMEFGVEMSLYPVYHKGRSGASTTPDFHRLSVGARLALVQNLDAITRRHRQLRQALAEVAQVVATVGPELQDVW